MPEGKKAAAPAKKAAAKKTAAKKAAATAAAGGGNPAADAAAAGQLVRERRAAARETRAQASSQRAAERHQAFRRREAAATAPGPGKAKKAVSWAWSGNRRLLTAQYLLCVVVLGLGWMVAPAAGTSGQGSKASSETTTRAMIKFSALSGLFFLLAIVSAGGKGAAKTATALGTLVSATYLFTSSDAHAVMAWVASFFGGSTVPGESGAVFNPGDTNDVGTPSDAFGVKS